MPSHKHKRERSRSHSRPRAREEPPSSPPSSTPPPQASKSRRASRAYRDTYDDDKYHKPSHHDDKHHRSRHRRYSSEVSEEGYASRRWPREDEQRERSRPSRRHEGRQSGIPDALPTLSNEQFAQFLAALQRGTPSTPVQPAAANAAAHAAVPVMPFKVEPPAGLVRTPLEEEEEEDWDKINQEADDILNDLEDNVNELLTKVPDSTTQLKDLPPMFDALIDVFNGLAIGQQTDIMLKTHKETREKIAQLLTAAHEKALVIQAKAAEEIAKIAPAEEEKARLIAEARVDFTKILAAQDAQLAGLRKDLDRVEAKAFKEVVKLPTAEDIKKAARREAYRTMAEKL